MRATCPTHLNCRDIYKANNDRRATITITLLIFSILTLLSVSLSPEYYSPTLSTYILLLIKERGKTEFTYVSISGF
jgi:hypothetical protein